jgi:hypothetical protein
MNPRDLIHRVPALIPGSALVFGILLLGWGATLWRFTAVLVGLAIGAGVGLQIGDAAHDADIGLVAAGVLAIGVALLFYLVERLAFAGLGAVATVALLDAIWPLVYPAGHPTDLVRLGVAAVGLLLGWLLHQRIVQVTTAVAGASLVAWSLQEPGNIWIVGPLTLLGALFQAGRLGGGGGARPAPAKVGKKKRREE